MHVDDTRLHQRATVRDVDLLNLVHPRQRQHQRITFRHAAAGQPGACPTRNHCHAVAIGKLNDSGNLLRRSWEDHNLRTLLGGNECITFVDHCLIRAGKHTIWTDDALQL
jgi:hypothetical protein